MENATEERKRQIIDAILASENFRRNMNLEEKLLTLYDGEESTVDMVLDTLVAKKAAGNLNFFSISAPVYFLLSVVSKLATHKHAMRVAEILTWDELVQGGDRTYRTMIPEILERIGDKSVVPALKTFSIKVRGIIYYDNDYDNIPAAECNKIDQECVARAIKACRARDNNK